MCNVHKNANGLQKMKGNNKGQTEDLRSAHILKKLNLFIAVNSLAENGGAYAYHIASALHA